MNIGQQEYPLTYARDTTINIDHDMIFGTLSIPDNASRIVLFAHGSGSSRFSPRNRYVADFLNQNNTATFLLDLLTQEEEARDALTGALRFDIELLAQRLLIATQFTQQESAIKHLPIGYFGASTGAGAALIAAANNPNTIKAVVSRGGRPDLAEDSLRQVTASTLLIVGEEDRPVIDYNKQSLEQIRTKEKRLEIVPGATHLFEEPGTLKKVAELASDWFQKYLF